MMNLKKQHTSILDLPDEILLIILKKLDAVDVLYSLGYANRRFLRLISDSQYISDLDLTHLVKIDSINISRICEQILPYIHHHVQKLTVEENTMREIFLAGTYPQLYSLSLVNFQRNVLYRYLKSDPNRHNFPSKQITHLNISMVKVEAKRKLLIIPSECLQLILCRYEKLANLKFDDIFPIEPYLNPFIVLPSNFTSSTLVKLEINVGFFSDCLRLLDGCLNSLSTLIIKVFQNESLINDIDTTKKLPRLKYFSYTSFDFMYTYDGLMVRLLRRMINLEQLQLCLSVIRFDSTYIDGIQLNDQFLSHMANLKKFTFHINTKVINCRNIINLQSNEDIQRTFTGKGCIPIVSSVDVCTVIVEDECQICSLPYDFQCFVGLGSIFQRGMFEKVQQLTVTDKTSLEQEFFRVISEGFPFLKYFRISSSNSMKDKQYSTALVTYPHLAYLVINDAHVDYALLFLLRTNSHLPRLTNLRISDTTLVEITNNFTNDPKQFHFDQLKNIDVCALIQSYAPPENFHQYFPSITSI